jgi:SAM-dependent methyltransferase
MSSPIRTLAKRTIPKPLLLNAWAAYCRFRARRARQAFLQAPDSPAWLGWEELDRLQHHYPLQEWTYHYDPASLARRGRGRASEMLRLVPGGHQHLRRFLDLGAWDGMVCSALQQMGKEAFGVDIRPEGLAAEARQKAIRFLQMDARYLGFRDESVDFVFSYNSFEHFQDPEQVMREALRVVRPGGYIYLNFGPLYYTPKGAHQFRTISVPYCECLFTKELLTRYAGAKGITLMGFFWMNEWPLTRYRQLWERYAGELECVANFETYNASYVNLIERYPSCFRSKTSHFEDLLVPYIEILFRKR